MGSSNIDVSRKLASAFFWLLAVPVLLLFSYRLCVEPQSLIWGEGKLEWQTACAMLIIPFFAIAGIFVKNKIVSCAILCASFILWIPLAFILSAVS